MRLRNIPGSEAVIAASSYVIGKPKDLKGKWSTVFSQKAPIHIEIGMGKGQFLTQMAKMHPEINYIGMELYPSVLLRAVQMLEEEDEIVNLKLICMDAKEITELFAPEEINRIYLNFSDPWPKMRHAKRRLPSKEFLERYEVILDAGGYIEFKTDNRALFDFAVQQAEQMHWTIRSITYDLHHDKSMNEGNVMTEYEQKFSSKGNPIYQYSITKQRQQVLTNG